MDVDEGWSTKKLISLGIGRGHMFSIKREAVAKQCHMIWVLQTWTWNFCWLFEWVWMGSGEFTFSVNFENSELNLRFSSAKFKNFELNFRFSSGWFGFEPWFWTELLHHYLYNSTRVHSPGNKRDHHHIHLLPLTKKQLPDLHSLKALSHALICLLPLMSMINPDSNASAAKWIATNKKKRLIDCEFLHHMELCNIVHPELLKPLFPNMPTFSFNLLSNFELAQSMHYCVHCPAPTHNSQLCSFSHF